MSVAVIMSPPAIVALEEVKRQLKIDDTTDDTLLNALIAAAQATIDGPDGWLGRALGPQVLELRLNGFGYEPIGLPYGPVTAVTQIAVLDASGIPQVVAPGGYWIEAGRFVHVVAGTSWPAVAVARSDAVRIQYIAGWPIAPAVAASGGNPAVPATWTGPAPIRHAILMMVGRLYAARGEDISGSSVEDRTIGALLSPWRVWSL